MVRLQPHLATCVANLPDSTIICMEGFKWTPPTLLDVWTDNWFLRQEAETWQKVMVARPYARDREGNVCEFTVLNVNVCPLDHSLESAGAGVLHCATQSLLSRLQGAHLQAKRGLARASSVERSLECVLCARLAGSSAALPRVQWGRHRIAMFACIDKKCIN